MMALFDRDTLESWADNIEDNYDQYRYFSDLRTEVLNMFLDRFGLIEAWGVIESKLFSNWHQHLKNLEESN